MNRSWGAGRGPNAGGGGGDGGDCGVGRGTVGGGRTPRCAGGAHDGGGTAGADLGAVMTEFSLSRVMPPARPRGHPHPDRESAPPTNGAKRPARDGVDLVLLDGNR